MKKKMSAKNRLSVLGFLFGSLFPLGAWLILTFVSQNSYHLFLIICSAPFVLGVVARMVGNREDQVADFNASLIREVELQTKEISSMMDLSGQGFLTFNRFLRINPQYSRECEAIFGEPIEGKYIHELLFKNPSMAEEFAQGVKLFFKGKVKADVIFDLLEKDSIIGGRYFNLGFRKVSEDKVLCVLTDVTHEKTLDEKNRAEEERRNILLNAVSHKFYFASFIREARQLFDYVEVVENNQTKEALEDLYRKLHTLKGNAGFFGFHNTEEVAHDFEYYIADSIALGEEVDLSMISMDLKKIYYDELFIIKDILGQKWLEEADSVPVPRDEYIKIEEYIKKKYPGDDKLISFVEHFRKVPLKDLFARFPAVAQKLADQLGKQIKPLHISGGDFLVLPDRYEDMVSSFIHILRNMMDHGIEVASDREILHKDPRGSVSIDIQQDSRGIVIKFTDDGRGVSLAALREKAVAENLLPDPRKAPEEEILKLIFHQDVSTVDDISTTSGRGVGLAAVKEMVEEMGGIISVLTTLNEGTTFEIIIPRL